MSEWETSRLGGAGRLSDALGLGSGSSLHSPATSASRIGSFWELGLWIPRGVLEAARALNPAPLVLASQAGPKERKGASELGRGMSQTTWSCVRGGRRLSSIFLLVLMECCGPSQTGSAQCSCLLLTPKGPETRVSSPVLLSLGMAPGHCRAGLGP